MNEASTVPFLKWPGGKRSVFDEIAPLIGEIKGRYYEPFIGGGAVFFGLSPTMATISDSNEDLINTYLQVRDNLEELIQELSSMTNSETDYYNIRAGEETNRIKRAARLIYLTALSFNGIYRLNKRGEFNVPYCQRTNRSHYNEAILRNASTVLQGVDIIAGDFEDCVLDATANDVVYFDPPYTVAHENNGFVKYNDRIFSWKDQERLCRFATQLAKRHCRVVVSNANHESIHNLYADFEVRYLKRASVIAASTQFRKPITECVFFR